MKVLRDEDVFMVKRITGPSHNLLALDFTAGRPPYVKDLAEAKDPSVSSSTVLEQVDRAMAELDVDRSERVGIQLHGEDTPSDFAYFEMAKVILEHRRNGTELDEFVSRWTPPDAASSPGSREEE